MKTSLSLKIIPFVILFLSFLAFYSCSKNTPDPQTPIVVSTNEFVHFSIDGVPGAYDVPADSVWQPLSIYFSVVGRRKLPVVENFSASFDSSGIHLGSFQKLIGCSGSILPGPSYVPVPVFVEITEFGNIGEYVSGKFSGNIQYVNPPNTIYHIDFSFRVKRTQ